MKGILLAGGTGSRLFPATLGISKQLVPVYDKPMVYYPLSVLMLAGVREILVIATPDSAPAFRRVLGDGSRFGVRFAYAAQERPDGLPQALTIGREFLGGERCALALGDNLLHGAGLGELVRRAASRKHGATAFVYRVRDPQRYGVLELDGRGRPVSIEEKPAHPRAPWAVVGLYFLDRDASDIAASLRPSARGETEITDLLRTYLERGELAVERLGRGFAWLDTGTPDALLQAANFVQTIEQRQGAMVACPEEIALHMGYVEVVTVRAAAAAYLGTAYGAYLERVADEHGGLTE